jgi:hypothetical protein
LLALQGRWTRTRFLLLEPGEGPGDVAAGLDHVAPAGNSAVLVAGPAGQLAGCAEARGDPPAAALNSVGQIAGQAGSQAPTLRPNRRETA